MRISYYVARFRHRLGSVQWKRIPWTVFHGPRLANQAERNIWYLYVEVFWAAVLSAAAAFNATFAVRLGASNAMIGWLSSIPSLIAVFLLIPAARFLESRSRRAPWLWGSLFVARLGYGLVAVLPWVMVAHRAEGLVWLLIAITAPATVFNAGFNPLLADVVPERDRARVFANRSIISSAAVAVLTLLAGRWLEAAASIRWAAFPANYQVMYIVGFAASLLGLASLVRIRAPSSKVVQRQPKRRTAKVSLTQLRAMFAEHRDFVRMIANTMVFDLGAWLVGPLYILLFVRELGATDGWIGLNSTLANLGVVAGYSLWRRWIRRLGYNRTLLITLPLAASYAFLVGLFPNLTAILVWGVLINLVNPGVNLSHFNILLKLCPDDRRASYMAIYSTMMNVGAFVCPMIGVALSELWGVRTVLLVGGGIRLAGASMFYIFRVRVPEVDIG